MKPRYPFPHFGPVFVVADERFEIAYYARDYCKFKRVREIVSQTWQDTVEQPVDADIFWMVAACVEKARIK